MSRQKSETTIALLRGINVGGRAIVPMRDLVACLESLGYENVRTADPSRLHIFFLAKKPDAPKLEAIEKLKAATERYELTPRAFYLHAPDGIGRSKLAAAVERLLGVPVTARNWRTVEKLLAMADGN